MIKYHIQNIRPNTVCVMGVPIDENSSFARGSALAPPKIREALYSDASNLCTESALDLGADDRWLDIGDMTFSADIHSHKQIKNDVASILAKDARVIALGGDHSITYPIIQAHATQYPKLDILQLDAHPDLYDNFENNKYSHASPFARIMEEKLCTRLVQLGIRTMNPHQKEQSKKFKTEIIRMRDWKPEMQFNFENPVYLSIDMDVLEPGCAPGISHYEPGGFITRQLLNIIQNIKGNLISADIVEYNPNRDINDITASVASKILKEVLEQVILK